MTCNGPLPVSEWVIKFNGFLGTADSEVYIVHISHIIETYTLESLSSLTITHNLQATINFNKKDIKNETKKKCGHPLSWLVIGDGNSTSVYNNTKP